MNQGDPEAWLKPLDAQVRGQLRQMMAQQTDGHTIILRPRPLPTRQRQENPFFIPQTIATTSTTSTTTSTTSSTSTTSTTTTSTSTTSTTTTSTTLPPTTTTSTTTTPPPSFTVDLIVAGNGSATFDSTTTTSSISIGGVAPGVYNLLATVDPGWVFVQWMVTGGASVTDAFSFSTTVTVTGDCSITAVLNPV